MSEAAQTGSGAVAVVNARIWTGEAARPWCDAIAAYDGRITQLGSSAEIRKNLPRNVRVINGEGCLVVPGFIDSHIHLLEGGLRLGWVRLAGCSSREALAAAIGEYADRLARGEWILGGDWDHQRWGGTLPERSWIDHLTPQHPVWVTRHDGHMGLANSLALQMAGVAGGVEAPAGGRIEIGGDGAPTGVLKDRAMELVARVIPAPGDAALRTALLAAMRHLASHGVTAVHNMGTWENLRAFERAHAESLLTTRIRAALPLKSWREVLEKVRTEGRGDEWLQWDALKEFVDGSLGSRTALFAEPYSDGVGECGVLVTPPEELLEQMLPADRAGLQLVTHAIGDEANRILLDVYAQIIERNGARDRRMRVEHAQHLHASDIPRFGELGVIASVQPYHLVDDGCWAERVIGADRMSRSYAFGSLQREGALLAMGSDWFVAPPDPLRGMAAAVTRRTRDGMNAEGWVPTERLHALDALRAYTSGAAFACFAEKYSGTLSRGKVADLAVIDRDLTALPPDELEGAQIVATIVGGTVVYER